MTDHRQLSISTKEFDENATTERISAVTLFKAANQNTILRPYIQKYTYTRYVYTIRGYAAQ